MKLCKNLQIPGHFACPTPPAIQLNTRAIDNSGRIWYNLSTVGRHSYVSNYTYFHKRPCILPPIVCMCFVWFSVRIRSISLYHQWPVFPVDTDSVFCEELKLYIYKKKGKAVPLQAWSVPEGSRKLRFPDFVTTAQDGGKVVSPTHRPT